MQKMHFSCYIDLQTNNTMSGKNFKSSFDFKYKMTNELLIEIIHLYSDIKNKGISKSSNRYTLIHMNAKNRFLSV